MRDVTPRLALSSFLNIDAHSASLHQVHTFIETMDSKVPEDTTAATCSSYSKSCTLCTTPRDVLVRCQIDATEKWHFVCPGKCWKDVSGGVIDGDGYHKHYRYGGTWKNKHEAVSGKKKKRMKAVTVDSVKDWQPPPEEIDAADKDAEKLAARYIQNDKVRWQDQLWICRRSHFSSWEKQPSKGWTYWKEAEEVFREDKDRL